ncbi:ataxin-10 [Hylaeus volcanicus]|uniref:ataxin-10 n=1 Tax=Hylaeus volcanicus TaxID=313075 RepID=UPI0023B7D442|nr:ataxin-10 [Hylaeus volcanicus]
MNTNNIDLIPKLEAALSQQNWEEVSSLLNPKLFRTLQSEELIAFSVLAKVAQILVTDDSTVPKNIKIACLKCLGNSCFNGYKHKEYIQSNIECGIFCHKLYSRLATSNESFEEKEICQSYASNSHFPYEGVIEWTSNFIISYKADEDLLDEQLEILRLSVQFLCNLFTFACKDTSFPDQYNVPKCLYDTNLKTVIMNLTHSEHVPLIRASCVFIHNALKEFEGKTFTELEKIHLCSKLLKPIKNGFESAKESLMFLLCQSNVLRNAYNDMDIEDKLYLLEIIHSEISDTVYNSKKEHLFAIDTVEFLAESFCRKSDLILKTADTCSDKMEPTEIVIILDILGTLTSGSLKEYNFLKNYRSLLINCIYLLKSIQMLGKESNNCFTPMQRLSDVAPAAQGISEDNELGGNSNIGETKEGEKNSGRNDFYSHPAFGFKAGLIRVIGNMSYRNKDCQDLLREMDAIPLLLDCCNIDARNPLIMQWTILALRNLCENNPGNQEIIRNCTRTGIVENSVLQEMGLTLHEEEGKRIGIVPLIRDNK